MPDESATPPLPPETPPVKKHKRGDVREDGKVFWGQTQAGKPREQWVSKESFKAYNDKKREYERRKYWTDPEQSRKVGRSRNRKWREDNREKARFLCQKWRRENPERNQELDRKYQQANKYSRNLLLKNKLKNNPTFALAKDIRIRVADSLRLLNTGKTYRLKDYLGCSTEELKEHLEKQFLLGMSWENRSLWHIDHIVPLGLAKTAEEVYTLSHYTNLRPLWAKDNRSKNKRLPESLPEYIDARIQAIYQNARKQNV